MAKNHTGKKPLPLLVLDSAAILNDFSFKFLPEREYATTNKVMDEFLDMRSRELVNAALRSGLLQITDPCDADVQRVYETAKKLKLAHRLSSADISIIALAKALARSHPAEVLTDDYAVQRVLDELHIPFRAVLQPGISRVAQHKTAQSKRKATGKISRRNQNK